MHRPDALVVDDNQAVRDSLVALLEAMELTVHAAANGREALAVLRRTAGIGVVLTDILMPDMEGMELIRTLKREFPHLRIVAMSGGGRIGKLDYLSSAKALGADATIVKPFDPEGLCALISGSEP